MATATATAATTPSSGTLTTNHEKTMQTENDITKPEDSPKQETGEGCPGATCSQFPVWILGGRDANTFRKGNLNKIQRRPWKVASFATQAEADACATGICAAIGGMLTTVAFLDEETALCIDSDVCAKLGIISSANAVN